MKIRSLALLMFALSLASSPPVRSAHAAGLYRVTSELARGGEVFSRPILVVKPGEDGVLEVGGETSFVYQIRVTETGGRTVQLALRLQMRDRTVSPVIAAELGREVSVVEGDLAFKVVVDPQP